MANKNQSNLENNQVSIYNSGTNIDAIDSEDNSPNMMTKTPGSIAMGAGDSFQNIRQSIPHSYVFESSMN